jgi:hypothetical protein
MGAGSVLSRLERCLKVGDGGRVSGRRAVVVRTRRAVSGCFRSVMSG